MSNSTSLSGFYGFRLPSISFSSWASQRNAPSFRTGFDRSYGDVRQARAILTSLNLPTEIVLQILDHACYWPSRTFQMKEAVHAAATNRNTSAGRICLDADVLGSDIKQSFGGGKAKEQVRVKEIEFSFSSHDQGWTSEGTEGTFNTSSWLEVSILRPTAVTASASPITQQHMETRFSDPGKLQQALQDSGWSLVTRPSSAKQGPQDGEEDFAWYLQGNRVADDDHQYEVTWSIVQSRSECGEGSGTGDGFLEELKDGDRIIVWTRAKWPGWQSYAENFSMTVHYGF